MYSDNLLKAILFKQAPYWWLMWFSVTECISGRGGEYMVHTAVDKMPHVAMMSAADCSVNWQVTSPNSVQWRIPAYRREKRRETMSAQFVVTNTCYCIHVQITYMHACTHTTHSTHTHTHTHTHTYTPTPTHTRMHLLTYHILHLSYPHHLSTLLGHQSTQLYACMACKPQLHAVLCSSQSLIPSLRSFLLFAHSFSISHSFCVL